MIRQHRSVVLGGLVVAIASGCLEDESAKQRSQVQHALADAHQQLRIATIAPANPADDSAASVQQALEAVATQLSTTSGGEPGQRAAKDLLNATAHREMAVMDHERADTIEQTHRFARANLRGKLSALLDLESLAVTLESRLAAEELAMLDAADAEIESKLALVNEVIAALDEPIAEQTTANSSDAREVDRLRQEADAKLRAASEAGYADGFDMFLEAVELRRQADQIEFQIGWRETELGEQLQPQHDMASARVGWLQTQTSAIDEARNSIKALVDVNLQEAATNRQAVKSLTDEIQQQVDAIWKSSSTELAASYESAAAYLDQAATLAGQAARLAPKSAAQLVEAGVYEQQGRLRADQVRGLADQQAFLERLIELGGGGADDQTMLDEVKTRLGEAQQAGKAAFEKASGALAKVRGGRLSQQIDAMKQNITAASAALVGDVTPIAIVAPTTPTAPARPTGGTASGSPANGFGSPEALAQFLNSLQWNDFSAVQNVLAATRGTSPQATAWLAATKENVAATSDFSAAMVQAFPDGTGSAVGDMMHAVSGSSAIQQVTVKNQTADQATASYLDMDRSPNTLQMINQNGAWFLQATSIYQSMMALDTPGMPNLPMAEVTKMTKSITAAIVSLTKRMRNGDFKSPVEVLTALGEAMQKAMGPMMGNMPGMPSR
jgi:hypothetical protein